MDDMGKMYRQQEEEIHENILVDRFIGTLQCSKGGSLCCDAKMLFCSFFFSRKDF